MFSVLHKGECWVEQGCPKTFSIPTILCNFQKYKGTEKYTDQSEHTSVPIIHIKVTKVMTTIMMRMQYSTMLDIVGETRDTEETVLLYAHVYIISCMFLKEVQIS